MSAASNCIGRALAQPMAVARGLEARRYQLTAALDIADAAAKGRSTELRLPPGTGKTIIANMAALAYRSLRSSSRVMLVAPRRPLASQHGRYATWSYPLMRSVLVNDERVSRPHRLSAACEKSDLIIGLPGQLASSMSNLAISPEVTASIGLVLVDEFDEFLTEDFELEGPIVRCEQDFQRLLAALPATAVLALMSGSAPGALSGHEPNIRRLAEFIEGTWQPLVVAPSPKSYARYAPTARVSFVNVRDSEAIALDEAVDTDLILALQRLEDEVGPFDADRVMRLLSGIMSGKIGVIPVLGRMIPVSARIRTSCAAIQGAINRYSWLYEDLFDGYETAAQDVFLRNAEGEIIKVERQQFTHRPPSDNHQPRAQGKTEALLGLVAQRPGQRGVVMVRYVRLAQFIAAQLQTMGAPVELLHGDLRDPERDAALERFREGAGSVLVMTRDTGKRGLDLPEADYAILFSPKTREATVWQELNRIRSTVAVTKDSYVLVYGGTGEAARARDLAELMRASGRAYQIDWIDTDNQKA